LAGGAERKGGGPLPGKDRDELAESFLGWGTGSHESLGDEVTPPAGTGVPLSLVDTAPEGLLSPFSPALAATSDPEVDPEARTGLIPAFPENLQLSSSEEEELGFAPTKIALAPAPGSEPELALPTPAPSFPLAPKEPSRPSLPHVRIGDSADPALPSAPTTTAPRKGRGPGRATPATPARTALAPGTLLGCRYRIVRRLGRGGQGEVVLAEDLFLRRQVALKTLQSTLAADDEAVEALQQEVAAAHAVIHPGLARTFDLGQADDVTYLSMEFLEGESLATRLAREGQLPLLDVRRIGQEVATALEAAHQAGLIHRDLKPSNIQLTPERGAVILDYGLAAADPASQRGRRGSSGAELLRPSTTAEGTPRYMAPEQWRSELQGPATDLYAFGAILFECLTGRPPFTADNRQALMMAHIEEPAPAVRTLRPETPPALARVVASCLEKEPRRRPPSAAAVATALRPRSPWPRVWTALLALAALLVLLLAGWALWQTTSRLLLREMRPAVAHLAEATALRLDPADLDQVRSADAVDSVPFQRVQKVLRRVRQRNPEVRFIYTLRLKDAPADWEYVVSEDFEPRDRNRDGQITPDERGSKPGEPLSLARFPAAERAVREKQPQADPTFLADDWGITLSGYAPIRVKKGLDTYLLAVDVGNTPLEQLRHAFLGAFLLLGLLAAGGVILLRHRRRREPAVASSPRGAP
jgi:hypothetical protein